MSKTYRPEPRSRLKQNFTAIQVDDSYRQDVHDIPGSPAARGTPPKRSTGDGLRDLIDRQDQLLSHQRAVASRQDEIAAHLANQNNPMNEALLKQVLNNKDNMIANLRDMQAANWDEHSRNLFSKHIQYIVAFISRLNSDISGLEAELKGRDMAVIGTNHAVNKLEVHHVTVLQDVRSRIVRAEQAISKHTKDIALLLDDIRRLEGQIMMNREKLGEDIHRLEAEMISMTGELERQHGVQQGELSHFKSMMNQQLSKMDDRMAGMMATFNESLDSSKAGFEHHMERMEAKFKTMITKATDGWGNLMTDVDKRIQSNMSTLYGRLGNIEERSKRDRAQLQDLQQNIETEIMATLNDSLSYNNTELSKAKNEFRKGFTELQESITNLKGVVEGKRKIMALKVNREIGAVKRAIAANQMEEGPEGNTIIVRNRSDNEW